MNKKLRLTALLGACLLLSGCVAKAYDGPVITDDGLIVYEEETGIDELKRPEWPLMEPVPDYSGEPYSIIHDNRPYFAQYLIEQAENPIGSFRVYTGTDELGRPHEVVSSLKQFNMPLPDQICIENDDFHPVGWQDIEYPETIPEKTLYMKCQLLDWHIGGSLEEEMNMVTGTRYLYNTLENLTNNIHDYLLASDDTVLYRATPDYRENELLPRGIVIEVQCMRDRKSSFCVYCYNVQPGIVIDYVTGESYEKPSVSTNDCYTPTR